MPLLFYQNTPSADAERGVAHSAEMFFVGGDSRTAQRKFRERDLMHSPILTNTKDIGLRLIDGKKRT